MRNMGLNHQYFTLKSKHKNEMKGIQQSNTYFRGYSTDKIPHFRVYLRS